MYTSAQRYIDHAWEEAQGEFLSDCLGQGCEVDIQKGLSLFYKFYTSVSFCPVSPTHLMKIEEATYIQV